MHEVGCWDASCFATLTYRDEDLPAGGSLDKAEFTRFWKRLRKLAGSKLRYFGCGEYGGITQRPHYHAVIFGLSPLATAVVLAAWQHGHVQLGTVTFDSGRYVAGYMKKSSRDGVLAPYGDRDPPFTVCSRGLGKAFALANGDQLRWQMGLTLQGVRMSMPRYYRKVLGLEQDTRFIERAEVRQLEARLAVAERLGVGLEDPRVELELASIRRQKEVDLLAIAEIRKRRKL